MFFTASCVDFGKLVTLGSLLLLIFSQILVKEAMSPTLMDMALHSFDDQYLGCREEMMEQLEQGDYFQKEIAANKDYLRLWKKAQEALLKSPAGLLREMRESHATVLMAYTMNSSLHSQLNWATSTAGISPEHYRHNFSFKYFHFYLTTAIQILKEWQSSMGEHKCYQVHRGVKDLYIEAKLQEARTVVIQHWPLPFSLVCLEFPSAWPTVSDSLAASRYVPLNSRQEASGVPAATEGSIFPLLSAATLQLGLEHSAWFIKTDIPWTHSDNPKRKQELIHLHQELLDCMSTNFHATNELVGLLNKHLGCTITPIEMRERSTVKENCEIIIQVMSEIQHQVQKIDSDMKDKLEPVLYQKLYDIKEPELEKIAIAQRVFSVIFGEATSTAAMVAIKLLGSNHLTLTVSKLIGILAQIGASVLGGVSITIIGLGLEMILHAILGAVERSQLLTAVRSYEKHLAEFKAASEKYQHAIHEVTSLVKQHVQ